MNTAFPLVLLAILVALPATAQDAMRLHRDTVYEDGHFDYMQPVPWFIDTNYVVYFINESGADVRVDSAFAFDDTSKAHRLDVQFYAAPIRGGAGETIFLNGGGTSLHPGGTQLSVPPDDTLALSRFEVESELGWAGEGQELDCFVVLYSGSEADTLVLLGREGEYQAVVHGAGRTRGRFVPLQNTVWFDLLGKSLGKALSRTSARTLKFQKTGEAVVNINR